MFKLILSLILMLCSMFIGQSMSSRLYRRKEALTLFYRNFHTAASRLEYSADTVYELFESFPFEREEAFLPQWEHLLSQYRHTLKAQDISLLSEFARGFGFTDSQSEQKRLGLYLSLLEEKIDQAQSDIEKKARLYRILGFAAGLTLSLMLI